MELGDEIEAIKEQINKISKEYSEDRQNQNIWRASQLKLLAKGWEDRDKLSCENIKDIDDGYKSRQEELLEEVRQLKGLEVSIKNIENKQEGFLEEIRQVKAREEENLKKIEDKYEGLLEQMSIVDTKIDCEVSERKNNNRQLLFRIVVICILFLIIVLMLTFMVSYKR